MAEFSKEAQALFQMVVDSLTRKEVRFEQNNEELSIRLGFRGEDLPIDMRVRIDDKRSMILLHSQLPLTVPKEMCEQVARVICMINYKLVAGCFDYSEEHEAILYRLSQCYLESLIGEKVIDLMIGVTMSTVDEYNDKIFDFIRGKMKIEEFQ